MKCTLALLTSFTLFFAVPVFASEAPQASEVANGCKTHGKFKKILVLPGGGLEAGLQLGMYRGLVEKGWKPDLIISSCGSSIPASLIQAEPSLEKQRAYVLSERSYDFLKSVKVDDSWEGRKTMYNLSKLKANRESNTVKDFDEHHILNVPQTLGFTEFNLPFPKEGLRSIYLATELEYEKDKIGQKIGNDPLYKQIYFTDPDTAKQLEGFESALSKQTDSRIANQTGTVTNATMNQAIRTVISDPYLMKPATLDGKTYLGGSSDLYPAELAKCLVDPDGGQIVMSLSHRFSGSETLFLENAYGTDINERRKMVSKMPGIQFIDTVDFKEKLKADLFWPRPVPVGITGFKIKFDVPKDFASFQDKVTKHLDYGLARATSAVDGMDIDACERMKNFSTADQNSGVLISKTAGEMPFTAAYDSKDEYGLFIIKVKDADATKPASYKVLTLRLESEDSTNGAKLVGTTLNGSHVEAYVRNGKFEKVSFSDFPAESVVIDKTQKSVCESAVIADLTKHELQNTSH